MEIEFFHSRFKRIPRPQREKLLCAMIRVNYGTPWEGDLDGLKSFFPEDQHNLLFLGGLTTLIEALNPFADEPTDYGVEPTIRLSSNLDETVTAEVHSAELFGEDTVEILRDETVTAKNIL